MEIKIERINSYNDARFSPRVLKQHGCFLVNDVPYEIEIISKDSAIIRGKSSKYFMYVIEEFMFYTPQIVKYYNEKNELILNFPSPRIIEVALDEIQPSQFYIDEEKYNALLDLFLKEEDIIIQVYNKNSKYISLDGHTRMYIAHKKGFKYINCIETETDDYIDYFIEECQKRNVYQPSDMIMIPHNEFDEKWNRFCDEYFKDK